MKQRVLFITLIFLTITVVPGAATNFEDLFLSSESFFDGGTVQTSGFGDLTLSPESFYNGSDGAGGWESDGISFSNNYNSTYGSWDGFAYSNKTDMTTPGYENQHSAITGSGAGNTGIYAVGYVGWTAPPTITLPEVKKVGGIYVTNSTYDYLSMLNGDDYAKKFGGASGEDPDWFKLTITGKDETGSVTGTAEFYLADFRYTDPDKDYIVNTWKWVDLTGLGTVKSMEFTLSSSDNGDFGMNTPAYFCMDTRSDNNWESGGIVFSNNYNSEYGSWDGFAYSNKTDTTTPGYVNQYSAIAGSGAVDTATYALGYVGWTAPPTISLPEVQEVAGVYVTNSTYDYLSMLNGDDYAKKFGGASGEDPDWFKLTITGKDVAGSVTGTVEFYLADFRDADPNNDYIVNTWKRVDLTGLGMVKTIEFTLSSSDNGSFGMNTPAYFCMDAIDINGGNLTGKVTTKNPIVGYIAGVQNAAVTMTGSSGALFTASTDQAGNFVLENIPVDVYTLIVEASGFKSFILHDIDVSFDAASLNLDSQLTLDMSKTGDATGDGKLGLEDAIYILQVLSNIRN